MPSFSKTKETSRFLKIIQSSISPSKSRWQVEFSEDKITSHLDRLSVRQLGKLFSDPYWVNYPTWRYAGSSGITRSTEPTGRWYGTVISKVCKTISLADGIPFQVLQKKSVGVWALFCIEYTSGRDRISILKRAYKNKDPRVRLRAAKYLPVSYLPKMSKDTKASVRNMVIRRLGMDNCAEMFLHDKNRWIHRSALEAAPIESIDYNGIIERYRVSAEVLKRSGDRYAYADFEHSVTAILRKIPKEQLPYFLDLADLANSSWNKTAMKEIIEARMS